MDYEVKGVWPGGMPKKTWSEVIEKDCKTRQICTEDAVDREQMEKVN